MENHSTHTAAEAQIEQYQSQLRSLASELSFAEERERRRLAVAVHDHISQPLALAEMKLDAAATLTASTELVTLLQETHRLVAQAIDASRSLTFQLSPPTLYELGLDAALAWLAEHYQRYGLSISLLSDFCPTPLADDVRVLLFQSAREMVTNVIKHAQAREVVIATNYSATHVTVTVTDDGCGFGQGHTGATRDGGFGLFSIKERLAAFDGKLEIASLPGAGSSVTVTMPLSHS